LKANFKLEMGIQADTGASAQGGLAFGRAAWVGLSGDFGAIQLGRQNKPMFDAVDSIDPFGTGIIGGSATDSTSATGLGNLFFATNPRSNNTANYTTNNLSGLLVLWLTHSVNKLVISVKAVVSVFLVLTQQARCWQQLLTTLKMWQLLLNQLTR
jgi:hypothetical protein